jgi:hypothetical protein
MFARLNIATSHAPNLEFAISRSANGIEAWNDRSTLSHAISLPAPSWADIQDEHRNPTLGIAIALTFSVVCWALIGMMLV